VQELKQNEERLMNELKKIKQEKEEVIKEKKRKKLKKERMRERKDLSWNHSWKKVRIAQVINLKSSADFRQDQLLQLENTKKRWRN